MKVLIIFGWIPNYRVPVLRKLAERYELTVGYHFRDESSDREPFRKLYLENRKIGPVTWFKDFRSICRDYDVVLETCHYSYPQMFTMPFWRTGFKVVSHDVGIRAHYKLKFDLGRRKRLSDYLYRKALFSGDSVLVYMKQILDFWNLPDAVRAKCFETHNSVDVKKITIEEGKKENLLFVGTLYKEKRVDLLVDAYAEAFRRTGSRENFPRLDIIGKGDMSADLQKRIAAAGMEGRIRLCGAIYDEDVLADYFSRAIACVSPNQAGLSVLKSMGYGVPFVTVKDAVTGGEVLNIENGRNGILMDNVGELADVLADIAGDRAKYLALGRNAKAYYDTNASLERMVQGFADAIEYAYSH